ncbi:MAG TPA: PQQ-binding-like beta-propeller repeat protein [Thermoanaerobaculia bacterium]|nr:PQQ-binding-like beta-propeller repeat protein [Thermoanaerobaculia bacterium]
MATAIRMRIATGSTWLVAAFAASAAVAQPEWHQWRGADRDGHSHEQNLLQAWPEGGPQRVFEVGGLGIGYSSFSAAGDRLVTMGATNDEERVMALDARTGLVLWRTPNGPVFRNDRGDGPRGTPTIDGDRVFALGGNGRLVALELATGKVVWQVDLLREFGARNITWGISESPLVVDGKVLVNPGGRGAGVVALDRETGKVIWKSQDDGAGYSSAIVAEAGGTRQAIFLTAGRALGVDVADGKLLWSYDRVANRTANAATPIFHDGRVFVSSDYGTGCALLEIGPRGATEVYFSREMRNHHSSSVRVGNTLYGFSSAILTAMDFATGRVLWQDRSVGKGSVIVGDGRLYLLSERGVVGLAEISPEGYREHGRFSLGRSELPTWSHPIIHRGRLYLRDQDKLYAFEVGGGDASSSAR